jgi:hypothetical protein
MTSGRRGLVLRALPGIGSTEGPPMSSSDKTNWREFLVDSHSIRLQPIEAEPVLGKIALTDGAQPKTLDWKTTVLPGATAVKKI